MRISKNRFPLKLERLEQRHLLAADPGISEFLAANDGSLVDGDGNESDWIEIHNAGDQAIDLDGWYLTDSDEFLTKWPFPVDTHLGAGQYLVVFASSPTDDLGNRLNDYRDAAGNLHANFSLDADGEFVALVQPNGEPVSMFRFGNQRSDISFGIGRDQEGYFPTPTPGAPNGPALLGFVRDTQFSMDRGFYSEPFDVEITTATESAEIYYTLDGTVPAPDNPTAVHYVAPIAIHTTATLRAIAVAEDLLPTNVDTHTYLFLNDVLQQPAAPTGYPTQWVGRETISGDYEMDPEIVNHPEYGPQLRDALRALPTVSLVMLADDWFDPDTGIYSNSEERGDFWERSVSAEFFGFAGGREFQVDTGIQMQGNASRWPNRPKHNMRLVFADRFGPGRLRFPLFDNTLIDNHNSIILRGGNGDSWINPTVFGKAQYIRDQWHRDVQNAMGHDNSLQRYAHLYINGMYWGLFHLFERVEAQFMAEHFGGEPADYEIVKDIRNSGGRVEALDGNTDAWLEMIDRAKGDVTDPEVYSSVLEFLDLENFIDYVMVNFYTANNDWDQSNWRAGRLKDGGKFQFFFWDAERTDFNSGGNNGNNTSITRDITGKNNVNYPTWLHQRLSANTDYQMAWADRIQKHLFHDGVLTPERTAELWNQRADEIRLPIIAESARWGDAHVSNPRTQATWEDQLHDLNTQWFPQRTDILLNQLRSRGLFPDVFAPEFSHRGGTVPLGLQLELSTDLLESSVGLVLLAEGHDVAALVPPDASLDGLWYQPDFAFDETWKTGTAGVGFDRGDDLHTAIGLDLQADWDARRTSIYSRSEFTIDLDFASSFDQLSLEMKYDDGFVAYLNGVEVARSTNAPTEQPTFDSLVLGGRPDGEVLAFVEFDITAYQDLLIDDELGPNVLAIHGFNATRFSNDMLISAEIVARQDADIQPAPIYYTLDGSDPRLPGGAINGLGTTTFRYERPIELDETATVRARVLYESQWSPLDEATFVVNPADASALVVSEIHYNPAGATVEELAIAPGADNDAFEFVEITNISSASVNLLGVRFDDGIDFTFGDDELAAGERAVVVKDSAAFQARYGETVSIAGQYDGSLSNTGERIRLLAADGSVAVDFAFDDNSLWPQAADGVGASLVLIDETQGDIPLDKYYRWRSSSEVGGSPTTAAGPAPGVVVSEIVSNTDNGPVTGDAIELHNPTAEAIDISGWYLSDSAADLLKFEIPEGTLLDAGEYLVFTEQDFNPTPLAQQPHHFALSSFGDDVWLVIPDEGRVTTIVDNVHFGFIPPWQSWGVTPQSHGRLTHLSRIGLGCGGNQLYVAETVIETIHYLPSAPSPAAAAVEPNLDDNDLEYLVIGARPSRSLAGWRIRGGVELDLPNDANSGDWIVSFDPEAPENASKVAAFRTHHGLGAEAPQLIGGYSGSLSDTGEALRLQAPVATKDSVEYATIDEVVYDDQRPWPTPIPGEAISRKRTTYFGNDGGLWEHASESTPTPEHERGDFDGDGQIGPADLERLIDAVNLEIENLEYVLATNLLIPTRSDVDFFLYNLAERIWADATNDGQVDSADLNRVGLNWQQTVCGGWADGDFDGNNFVDASDLNEIGVHWLSAAGPATGGRVSPRTPHQPLAHAAKAAAHDAALQALHEPTPSGSKWLERTREVMRGRRSGRTYLDATTVRAKGEVASTVDEICSRLGPVDLLHRI